MAQTLPPDSRPPLTVAASIQKETPMLAVARVCHTGRINDSYLDDLIAELDFRQTAEREPSLSDDALDERVQHSGEVVDEIIKVQAGGLAGLRAKARAAVWCMGDEAAFHTYHAVEPGTTYDRVVHSIVSDLLATPSASVHAFPSATPDEGATTLGALQKAAADFLTCKAIATEASKRCTEAVEAACPLHPDVPDLIRNPNRPDWCLNLHVLHGMDENARRLTWPKPTGSPRVEAFHRWAAQKEAIDSSFGVQALEEAWEQARDAEDAAADRVVDLRPTTMTEAVLKYGVMLAAFYQDGQEIIAPQRFAEFLGDLEHVAGMSKA